VSDDETLAPPPRNRRGLRTGFTTGSCAAAAARAATMALLTGTRPAEVTIHLPIGGTATFVPGEWQQGDGWASCSVVKDAGDDPDVTHGAHIHARVEWVAEPGIHLAGGPGVGTVTRPGLGLEVDGPAINPVPRAMITAEVTEVAGQVLERRGLLITISVPGGEEMARKTLNGRLGIVGGISILGTWGIVKPYSTASWRASVVQAVDVAAANGQDRVVLSTGSRSEKFAMALYPELDELAFVEMGIFTGDALRACVRNKIRWAALAGMVGKFAKLAQGHMQTHVAGNQVDTAFLAAIAAACGAGVAMQEEIRGANTARHVGEIAAREGFADSFYARLAALTREQCRAYVKGRLAVEAVLFDFDGRILARAEQEKG
jgi:cobalt-precorrin-5B (C1)-methyltransferase